MMLDDVFVRDEEEKTKGQNKYFGDSIFRSFCLCSSLCLAVRVPPPPPLRFCVCLFFLLFFVFFPSLCLFLVFPPGGGGFAAKPN